MSMDRYSILSVILLGVSLSDCAGCFSLASPGSLGSSEMVMPRLLLC